jgi:hypothetical protein
MGVYSLTNAFYPGKRPMRLSYDNKKPSKESAGIEARLFKSAIKQCHKLLLQDRPRARILSWIGSQNQSP